MLIDGRLIAKGVYDKLLRAIATFPVPPKADIVIVGESAVIEGFVGIKKKAAQSLGIELFEHRFKGDITEAELSLRIKEIALRADTAGLIIQLPLPSHIAVQPILDLIPIEKDIDVLSTKAVALYSQAEAKVIPPVAGAVKEILDHLEVVVHGKEVLVLGYGRLVGKPVSVLLRHNGAHVTVIDRPVKDLATHVRESMLVISGVGIPNTITPDMLTLEHIVIDAGTSESEGKLVGDADVRCEEVARAITPVPGGVGPLTVAMLLKNLCVLAREKK